jgi:PadR family transcriptional regulator PadR
MKKRKDETGELLKGNTPTLILAVLEEKPCHGYAIAREIERRSRDALSLGEGSLYPALRALENDGLVVSAWETSNGAAGGPARRVYSLTEAGLGELKKRTRSWQQFARAVDDVLGGLPGLQPT